MTRSIMDERNDLVKLNLHLRDDLEKKGMVFNNVVPAQFREVLTRAGFYASWKKSFSDVAWSKLEDAVGKLD